MPFGGVGEAGNHRRAWGKGRIAATDPSASIHLCHWGENTCPGREGLLGTRELFPVYFDINVLLSGLVLLRSSHPGWLPNLGERRAMAAGPLGVWKPPHSLDFPLYILNLKCNCFKAQRTALMSFEKNRRFQYGFYSFFFNKKAFIKS